MTDQWKEVDEKVYQWFHDQDVRIHSDRVQPLLVTLHSELEKVRQEADFEGYKRGMEAQRIIDKETIKEVRQETIDTIIRSLPNCSGCTYDKDEGTHQSMSKQHFQEFYLTNINKKQL